PGSAAMRAAEDAGIPAVAEGFADRAYTGEGRLVSRRGPGGGVHAPPEGPPARAYPGEGRLVSRREPGAVLHDPEQVATRAVVMATEGRVETADGGGGAGEIRPLGVPGD